MVFQATDKPIFFLRFVLSATCAHVQLPRFPSGLSAGPADQGSWVVPLTLSRGIHRSHPPPAPTPVYSYHCLDYLFVGRPATMTAATTCRMLCRRPALQLLGRCSSSASVYLTPAHIASYQEDGVVLLKGALSAAELELAAEAIDGAMATPGPMAEFIGTTTTWDNMFDSGARRRDWVMFQVSAQPTDTVHVPCRN